MVTIDGNFGEGGGQALRSALALSLATGKPFEMVNIRGRRSRPGIMAPHLGSVEAAVQVSRAEARGVKLGSGQLTFAPQRAVPGWYEFVCGASGGATLILQMLLPALARAAGPSALKFTGGTHCPLSPPFDFLERAYLPVLARLGTRVRMTLERAGIYPGGVGSFMAEIEPARESPAGGLELMERGKLVRLAGRAVVAGLPVAIAKSQVDFLARQAGWEKAEMAVEEVAAHKGGGNLVLIEAQFEHVTEVFTAVGRMGLKPEAVAQAVLDEARVYLDSDAAVGEHLAAQMLIPMALNGGGRLTTVSPSNHARTDMHVIEQFLGVSFVVKPHGDRAWMIEVVPGR